MKIKLADSGKKAQIKIQQMAFVLLGIVFFLVLVGLLVISVRFSELKKTAAGIEDDNALNLAIKLANSPEFSCGNSFDSWGENCVDYDKITALKSLDSYKGFWGVGAIKVIIIDSDISGEKECSLGDTNCNTITVYSDGKSGGQYNSNFVSLCRKESYGGEVYDKCDMATLNVIKLER